MLGIPKYTDAELANFRGYPRNEAILTYLAEEPKRVEDHMFALLQELAEGGYPKVPVGIGFSVAKNPARLAPLADAMAKRFLELSNIAVERDDAQEFNYRHEGLAAALKALPEDAFVKIAPLLNAYLVEEPSFNKFSELRARAKRLSDPVTPAFFEADYMAAQGYRRLLPVLAICRIGSASKAVTDEMKTRMLQQIESPSFDEDNTSALVVTLLKLGERTFIQENRSGLAKNGGPVFESWVEAMLSGRGMTKDGPNNCTTTRFNSRRPEPALFWSHGAWRPKDRWGMRP